MYPLTHFVQELEVHSAHVLPYKAEQAAIEIKSGNAQCQAADLGGNTPAHVVPLATKPSAQDAQLVAVHAVHAVP